MKQKTKYYISNVLTVSSVLITGAVLQTFLLESGYSEARVAFFVSAEQATQVAAAFLSSFAVDRFKNVIRTTAMTYLLYLPLIAVLLLSAFGRGNLFGLLLFTGILANVGIGMYNVLSFKLPYYIMDIGKYAEWSGVGYAFAASAQLIFTAILSLTQREYGFFPVMRVAYFCGFILVTAMFLTVSSYRRVENNFALSDGEKIALFRYKPFTALILPNLLRGFGVGVVGMVVVIGYNIKALNAASAGLIPVIAAIITVPASLLFVRLERWLHLILPIGGLVMTALFPLMSLSGTTVFLVLYGIGYFFQAMTDLAQPVVVTKMIDGRIVGQYSGWRMILQIGGALLASAVCVPLLHSVGAFMTLFLGGFSQFLCGIAYYFYGKKTAKSDS